ncbi:hypothetical protein [Amycolatopsis sp. DG1A-15b]|uniref:hypothetical protein n=1 Tax=Amycolatopsis sp. DG1A-15b TaxID=3052846 RepID=UPI00255BD82F|nr:hypothetical protein [Amycolatopsis sp. DG1A-15b]WIX84634.1 hypothetical protein QRY02_25630 [Amycolatopsis sp. DG1A-15b]
MVRDGKPLSKLESWAVGHRAWACLFVAVLGGVLAWWLTVKYGRPSTGEFVFWAAIVIPVGIGHTWFVLTRLKRRRGRA